MARKKAQLGLLEVVEPPLQESFPSDGFSETLDGLPVINFRTVWTYMIACIDAKKQLSTAKPMVKGFNFYKSGHVLSITSHHRNARSYVKSQVLPSMKKTSAYSCYIVIRDNGLICRAFCGCPAGIDGRCNHVAATLFALEEYCKARAKQTQDEACTSQACKWNVPRKRKGDVISISNMKFQKHEYGKVKVEKSPVLPATKDVRAPHQRVTSATKLYNIFSKVKSFENKTGKVLGITHVLQSKTPEELKLIVQSDHCYCKPPEVNDEKINDQEDNALISPIKSHPVSANEVLERCQRIKMKLSLSDSAIEEVEASTRNQSSNTQWHLLRQYRITASKSYRCAVLKESTSPTKALEEVLSYKKFDPTQAMKEGLAQEEQIVKDYVTEKNHNGNTQVTVARCGFFVSKTHGYLGASPDGLVSDPSFVPPSGLLEMKYIQVLEEETLQDALLRKRICTVENDKLQINKTHKYNYQIQHQMYVTSKTWTDFVVKSSTGGPLYIERVFFNKEFWGKVFPKLELFFNNFMLPELAYPRLRDGLTSLKLNDFPQD